MEALSFDRHVLCEKPFVEKVVEAEEVMEAARERSKHVVVMHNWLFRPGIRETLMAIRSGKIGRPLAAHFAYTETHLRDEMGIAEQGHWVHDLAGGRAEESLPHLVYTLIAALDDPSVEVQSVAATKNTPYDWVKADTLTAIVASDRSIGTLFMTYASEVTSFKLQVHGTARDIVTDVDTRMVELSGLRYAGLRKRDPIERLLALATGSLRRLAGSATLVAREALNRQERAEVLLMRGVVECVERGAEPPVSAASAVATVRITNEIIEKLRRSPAFAGVAS
jgi:predicted dehydrogenase